MFNGVDAAFSADLQLTSVNDNIIKWIIVLRMKGV